MNALFKIVGWSLRVSAAICMTWIVVSVVQGSNGLTTLPAILQSVAFHAAFAVAGVQLCALGKRRGAAPREAEVGAA